MLIPCSRPTCKFVALGMLNVVILGTGNLARHLFEALSKAKGVKIIQVIGRNKVELEWFSDHTTTSNDFEAIADADVFLIAVKDDAITEVSKFLSSKNGVVAHTSGAMEMEVIQTKNKGVFYPLQSFTKGRPIDFSDVPICLEAESKTSMAVLKELAICLSENVQEIDSLQRKNLHLAAVFVNNFTNYLYGIGEEICVKNRLSFDLLKPLIAETAEKIKTMSPKDAQTGPARRNDIKSIQNHLELLDDKDKIALYTFLSDAIKRTYEKEL